MSDKTSRGGILYPDVVVALVTCLLVIGQVHAHRAGSGPALAHDIFGMWLPSLALALWVGLRRRIRSTTRAWPSGIGAAVFDIGISVVYWRWGAPPFVGAFILVAVLLAVGLALRTCALGDALSRIDAFRVITAVTGVVLTFALIEGVLRVMPGLFRPEVRQLMEADPRNYGIADPYIGFLQRPDTAIELTGRDFHVVQHVDHLGFRNTWPWPARADIVAVGDSLTFGYGVADGQTWPALLARTMAPARVINLGLIGSGPEQYFRVYQRFGLALQPKLLLVGFFGENDFWDAGEFDRWLRSGEGGNYGIWRDFGQPVRVRFDIDQPLAASSAIAHAIATPMMRHSYLVNLIRAIHDSSAGESRLFRFADGHRLELFEGDFDSKRALAEPDRPEFQLVVNAIREIQTLAVAHGTRVLVVLQPGKEEVYLPLLGEPVTDTTTALRPALDKLGIDYLDLDPVFRAHAAAGDRLFFEVDGHPNAAGYALIAHTISEYVTDNAAKYGIEP